MKSKISSIVSGAGLALAMPFLTFASGNNSGYFGGTVFISIITFLQTVLRAAFPIITGVLIVLFGWQVVKYLTDKEETAKAIHKSNLLKALAAVFLWFVLTGLIRVLANSFGVDVGNKIGQQDITTVDFHY